MATTTKLKNKLTFYNSRKALTFGTIFRLSLTFAFAAFSRFAFVASLPELQLHCFCRFLAQNSTLDLKEEGQNHSFAEEKLLPTSWRRRSLAYESSALAMATTRMTLLLETTFLKMTLAADRLESVSSLTTDQDLLTSHHAVSAYSCCCCFRLHWCAVAVLYLYYRASVCASTDGRGLSEAIVTTLTD